MQNTTKLQELDDLLTDHFIKLLKSKKPIKGTTLAVIKEYLKSKSKDSGSVTLDASQEAQGEPLDMEKLPFPGD
jgi:DNA-binding transcriptional MerR regulator